MNTSIILWISFLEYSFGLFTPLNRVSVFHHKHHPCANTAGDILFEFSPPFQTYFNLLIQKYLECSDNRGQEGELDFVFDTLESRKNEGLDMDFWIAKVTEVEKMTRREVLDFVYSEVTAAVAYLKEYFIPQDPPWVMEEEEEDEGAIVRGSD